MALPVLDGNQTATTLSSVVTGGEHIVAHSVVSLGATAIANITSAVSGSVVSISNFPSTQTIAGTVTASLVGWDGGNNEILRIGGYSLGAGDSNRLALEVVGPSHDGAVVISGLPAVPIYGTVTVGNSVTIGSLPAISGTVTVGNTVAISGTVTANPTGTQTVAGTVTVSGISTSVTARLVDSTGTAVSYAATGSAGTPSTDVISVQGVSGGTSLPISGTAGTLTTRFGSVTTANTAQISSAVTNTSRKYLLIQNVTTSSNVITVGIGFTPTTTQGIQLTAGAGITFESSYIPTGAVYVLSSVTASPFTILEA